MVTRVNSFPKVLHEYFHFLVHLMRTDNDTAILRRVVDGVGKEVREYPGDLLTVYKELGYFSGYSTSIWQLKRSACTRFALIA